MSHPNSFHNAFNPVHQPSYQQQLHFSGTTSDEWTTMNTRPEKTETKKMVNTFENVEDAFDHFEKLKKSKRITIIDSRDRDTTAYPLPNDYYIDLPESYDRVYKIELIGANIPLNSYNITPSNNTLYFSLDGTTMETIQMTPGFYTVNNFIEHFNTQMASVLGNINKIYLTDPLHGSNNTDEKDLLYHQMKLILQVANKNSITIYPTGQIETDTPYTLNGANRTIGYSNSTRTIRHHASNSMSKVLGLRPDRIFSVDGTSGATSKQMDFKFNLGGEPYVILDIDESRYDGVSNSHRQGFAHLMFDVPIRDINSQVGQLTRKFIKASDLTSNRNYILKIPPINRLSRLHIRFLDPEGNLYDFQGQDHSLQFEFTEIRTIQN